MSKGIRCGNHGRDHVYHATAADVRACFADRYDFDSQARQEPKRTATFGPTTTQPVIPWPEDPTVALNARARAQEPQQRRRDPEVSITKLRLDRVQAGGYAVPDPADGKLRFLEVDKPTDGQWQDWTFVKIMASDERHKLGSVNPRYGTYKGKAVDLVARLAGADIVELNDYRIAYGKELGECGFCRRTLTDEDSRGLGYGPVCAGRNGLYHPRARGGNGHDHD